VSVGRKGALLVALSAAFTASAVGAAAPAASVAAGTSQAAAARACSKGVMARIAGKRTCLKNGRSCVRRHQRQYKRNGYTCKRTSKGYRLRKVKQEF
jgi:hypothetical protein